MTGTCAHCGQPLSRPYGEFSWVHVNGLAVCVTLGGEDRAVPVG